MFPSDSITVFQEISGNVSITLINNNDPLTVLAISLQQSKDLSDTQVYCGNDVIAKNYGKDFQQALVNFKCTDDIILQKTGNDEASIILTYIPYYQNDFYYGSTSNQGVYNPTTNISTSSDIQIYGSFSAGEILIAFLLICMIVLTLIKFIASALSNIKTKKTYLSYGGGDVEIRDDL